MSLLPPDGLPPLLSSSADGIGVIGVNAPRSLTRFTHCFTLPPPRSTPVADTFTLCNLFVLILSYFAFTFRLQNYHPTHRIAARVYRPRTPADKHFLYELNTRL